MWKRWKWENLIYYSKVWKNLLILELLSNPGLFAFKMLWIWGSHFKDLPINGPNGPKWSQTVPNGPKRSLKPDGKLKISVAPSGFFGCIKCSNVWLTSNARDRDPSWAIKRFLDLVTLIWPGRRSSVELKRPSMFKYT